MALWIRERRSPKLASRAATHVDDRWLAVVPVVFVAALALANVQGVARWTCSLDAFRDQVDRASGIVAEDAVLPPNRRRAVWGWTSSSLSLVVRGDAGAGILSDPSPSFTPFPPGSARDQLGDEYTWRMGDWPATCAW